MKRTASIISSGILTALTLVTVVVWIAGLCGKQLGYYPSITEIDSADRYWILVSCRDDVVLTKLYFLKRSHHLDGDEGWWLEGGGFLMGYSGTRLTKGTIALRPPVYALALPYWFLVILFAVYPVVTLRRWGIRRRRRLLNKCLECGYNLTGNVSGRCPECGVVIERREAAE